MKPKNNIFKQNLKLKFLTNKKTKVCDETDFTNPNYLKDYGLKNSICSENDTFNIGGYWTEPFISYMRILLFPCKKNII